MATIISNQASATYTYEGSSNVFTASSNIASTTLMDDFSLDVKKLTHQNSFQPNENITYSIIIKNTGVKEVKDIKITINTESYTSFLPNSARLMFEGSIVDINPSQTSPLEFIVPNVLQANNWLAITYVMNVNETISDDITELSDFISVTSPSIPSSKMSTFTAEDYTKPTRAKSANLVMNKQVSKSSIQSSDSYNYTISISNTGLLDANNVVITDALPTGFKVETITLETLTNSHTYTDAEYDINSENVLTLPNANGTPINISASNLAPSNNITIHICGIYNSPILDNM